MILSLVLVSFRYYLLKLSLKIFLKEKEISLLKRKLQNSPIHEPIHWPRIVAYAAPAIPSFGKGPIPKISIGSKIILIIAPVAWESML